MTLILYERKTTIESVLISNIEKELLLENRILKQYLMKIQIHNSKKKQQKMQRRKLEDSFGHNREKVSEL